MRPCSSPLGTKLSNVRSPAARPDRLLPLPRVLEHARVCSLELELDLAAPACELADLASLLCARALDLPVHARELELQALNLEHVGTRGLAPGFDEQLCDERGQLGI